MYDPQTIIQPFVENAVIHGGKKEGKTLIAEGLLKRVGSILSLPIMERGSKKVLAQPGKGALV